MVRVYFFVAECPCFCIVVLPCMLLVCPWCCFPCCAMGPDWCFFVRKRADVTRPCWRGVALGCISECCWERWRRPTSRAGLQGFEFSRSKVTTGWCSCMCNISVSNVVYLVVGWSPLSRERGCCKLDAFILTLLGCMLFTGRKFALQCGRSMVELSWTTMADLIVFLCT